MGANQSQSSPGDSRGSSSSKRTSKVVPLGKHISTRVLAAGKSVKNMWGGGNQEPDSPLDDIYTAIWGKKTQKPIPAETVRAIDRIIAVGKQEAELFDCPIPKSLLKQPADDSRTVRSDAGAGALNSAFRTEPGTQGAPGAAGAAGAGGGGIRARIRASIEIRGGFHLGRKHNVDGSSISSIPSSEEVIQKAVAAALAAQAAAVAAANPHPPSRFGRRSLDSNANQAYAAFLKKSDAGAGGSGTVLETAASAAAVAATSGLFGGAAGEGPNYSAPVLRLPTSEGGHSGTGAAGSIAGGMQQEHATSRFAVAAISIAPVAPYVDTFSGAEVRENGGDVLVI